MVESREKDKEAVVRPWAQVMGITLTTSGGLIGLDGGKKQR